MERFSTRLRRTPRDRPAAERSRLLESFSRFGKALYDPNALSRLTAYPSVQHGCVPLSRGDDPESFRGLGSARDCEPEYGPEHSGSRRGAAVSGGRMETSRNKLKHVPLRLVLLRYKRRGGPPLWGGRSCRLPVEENSCGAGRRHDRPPHNDGPPRRSTDVRAIRRSLQTIMITHYC